MATKRGSKAVKRGKRVIVKDLRPKTLKTDQAKSVKGGFTSLDKHKDEIEV
jgi:hypothetical protein